MVLTVELKRLVGAPFELWCEEWQPTPVFLPGESHGQRSLAGYRPWGPGVAKSQT